MNAIPEPLGIKNPSRVGIPLKLINNLVNGLFMDMREFTKP